MIFKQRLFTALLGLLFTTVLTGQASALYDPGVGRFCSRDPIGYVGGQLSLLNYVDSRPTFFVDPLGWELTLVPARIENHPWSHKPLNRGTLGETNAVFSVTCKCKTHWDWFGVCYLRPIPWANGLDCDLHFKLETTIHLDDIQIGGPGRVRNGIYGHEIIHAINYRRKARELHNKGPQSGRFDSELECIRVAIDIENEWYAWRLLEHHHANPESPHPKGLYPIDYQDDYNPIISFPLPLNPEEL